MRCLVACALVALFLGCSPRPALPPGDASLERSGPWLGEATPAAEAVLFAPGFVSTGLYERDLAITPDGREIYWGVVLGNYEHSLILVSRRVDGRWTEPEAASFSGRWRDLEPAIAPDGRRIYFASHRPREAGQPAQASADLWFAERQGDAWGEPRPLGPPVNTDAPEFFPSLTRDGTLYFTRDFAGGESAIFRARPAGDGWAEPERLGPQVNASRAQYNGFVAPDESYLIYAIYGRDDSLGASDYYVSFRDAADGWTGPVHLGAAVNSDSGLEYSPYVSPDGRYFFFMAAHSRFGAPTDSLPRSRADLQRIHDGPRNGLPDIYWIDAGWIEALRP